MYTYALNAFYIHVANLFCVLAHRVLLQTPQRFAQQATTPNTRPTPEDQGAMGPKATTRQRSTLSSFGKGGTKAAQQALAASNAKGKAKSSATLSRSSSATDLKQQDKPTYTKEQLAESEGKDDLDPNDPAFDGLWDDVMKKMGMPKLKPIHSEGMNRIDHILRVFDLDPA